MLSSLSHNILKIIILHITLGFGYVIKQGPSTNTFVVEDMASVALLVSLFNGNFVFPMRQSRFSLFKQAFNNRSKVSAVMFISTLVKPTFSYFWLCCFTDVEGCFTCSLLGNSKAYRFRYMLAQQGDVNLSVLTWLTTLLGGVVRPHSARPPLNERLR